MLALCAMACGFAAETFAGWTYNPGTGLLTDGNWQLTASGSGNLTIKGMVTGSTAYETLDLRDPIVRDGDEGTVYAVTAFADSAFSNNKTLTTLYLPETVTSIGSMAFLGCSALTTVSPLLPKSVTWIGYAAFHSCGSLTGDVVLDNETSLSLGRDNNNGRGTFQYTAITSIDISAPLGSLPDRICSGCTSLKRVNLPPTVKAISVEAFCGCTALESVSPMFTEGLTSLGMAAFYNCTSLTGDVVVSGTTTVGMGNDNNNGRGVFQNTKIRSMTISAPLGTTAQNWCGGCKQLEWVRLPDSGGNLKGRDFEGCTSLTNVTPFLPTDLSGIGTYAFNGCSKLAQPLVIAGTKSFSLSPGWPGHYGFSGVPIPTITITAPVTAIGNTSYGLVFNGNSALTEVDLPPELTVLGVQAFYNDKNLNRVKLRSERPPTISGTAFQDDGKVRLYVPRFSNYWEAFIAEKVTPMTEAQTNAFVAAFPDYPHLPLGKYVNGSNNIYVFDKDDDEYGDTAYVAGRPWRVNADAIDYGVHTGFTAAREVTIPATGTYEGVDYAFDFWQIDVETADHIWEKVAEGEDLSVTLAPDAQGRNVRLTVNWKVAAFAIDLTIHGGERNGSVEFEPSKPTYGIGEEVTLTAHPAEGRKFLCWLGDVPDELKESASITLTMSAARTISAVFDTDHWEYDKAAHTMTDGNWLIHGLANYNTAADNQNHTLVLQEWNYSGHFVTGVGAPQVLDLRKPIFDGDGENWRIRVLEGAAFSGFTGYKQLETVLLPDTIETFGACCFADCSALKTVTPLFPKATRGFGFGAFYNCTSLTGDVVIASETAAWMGSDNNNGRGVFQNTKITSVNIASPMTGVPNNVFGGCSKLEWARLPETLVSFNGNTFNGCASLTNVTPFLAAEIKGICQYMFNGCSKLATPLVLSSTNVTSITSGWPGHYGFSGTAIPSVVITSPLTALGTTSYGEVFSNNRALTEVDLPETLQTLGVSVFQNDTALTAVRFHGSCPANIAVNAFNSVTDYKVRVFYPKGDVSWNSIPVGTVTPWVDLTPAQTNKYWTNYPGGKRPTAMWSLTNQWTPNRNLWLLPWNPKPTGMKILFR